MKNLACDCSVFSLTVQTCVKELIVAQFCPPFCGHLLQTHHQSYLGSVSYRLSQRDPKSFTFEAKLRPRDLVLIY